MSLMNVIPDSENAPITTISSSAALVMMPPVRCSPVAPEAVLLALGLPFLRVSFGGIDARALPAGTESRCPTPWRPLATSCPSTTSAGG